MLVAKFFTKIRTWQNYSVLVKNFSASSKGHNHKLSSFYRLFVKDVRNLSTKSRPSPYTFNNPSIEKFKLNDKVPANYDLVYRATAGSYVQAARLSATGGTVAVLIFGIIYYNYDPDKSFQINFSDIDLHNIFDSQMQFVVFTLGFILINVAVMILTSKLPIRIYFNKDAKKYIGVLYGKIPNSKTLVEFSAGEVKKYEPIVEIVPWSDFRYKLKNGRTIILLDHYFRKPDDFNIMLGHTKL